MSLREADGAAAGRGSSQPAMLVARTIDLSSRGPIRIRVSGLSSPLEFINCPEVAEQLLLIMRGWTVELCDSADVAAPLIRIAKSTRGYAWRKALLPMPHGWRTIPPHGVYSAVCHLHHELVAWLVNERSGALCLHCASVEINGSLIILLGRGKAGKSTLATELTAAGARMFGDDVLMLENDHGVAFGLLPRLRLPLPKTMTSRARKFAAARVGISNKAHQYIDMKPGELALLGQRAPIAGLIVLDRLESGGAVMKKMGQGEMLKTVVLQNCLDAIPARSTFDRLLTLTQTAKCYRLSYAVGSDATRLITETFRAAKPKPLARAAAPTNHRGKVPVRCRQVKGVECRMVGTDMFLVHPATDAIHYIDPIGAAIWHLLAKPILVSKIKALLVAAFPDEPKTKIASALRKLMLALRDWDLIREVAVRHKPGEIARPKVPGPVG
jgi:hypothetical protein